MFSLLLPFALLWMAVSAALLSRGKPTTHSDTWNSSWVSALAVDGGYETLPAKGSCFHSNNLKVPFMTVDLQEEYEITNVIIYNRADNRQRIVGASIDLLNATDTVIYQCGKISSTLNIYDIPCGNKVASKVRISGLLRTFLHICELEVHGERPLSLLSRGKLTSHSSVFNDMNSSLAVDGRYDKYVTKYVEYDMKNCFMSNPDELPFFIVDLKGTFQIERVILYNREDCCLVRMIGAVVELLYANGELSHECARITEALPIYNISCGNNVAQKVRIVGAPEDHLQICEVDVFGRLQSFPLPISRSQPTTQSSVMASLYSSLAVDGNYRNFISTQADTSMKNCFLSDNNEVPFMEVDLLRKFNVSKVAIYNRMDCCSERILGAVVELVSQNGSVSHRCGSITEVKATNIIQCGDQPAYKVRVTALAHQNLQICELDVFGDSAFLIVSRGKPTSSSNVHNDLESSFAVDGIYEYDLFDEEGVNLFHSEADQQPFWEVDLQGKFNIEQVVIYNRMDCCAKRIIGATIELRKETGEVSYECGKITEVKAIYKIPCGNNVASKVRVNGPPNQYLHFSEVVVYGETVG